MEDGIYKITYRDNVSSLYSIKNSKYYGTYKSFSSIDSNKNEVIHSMEISINRCIITSFSNNKKISKEIFSVKNDDFIIYTYNDDGTYKKRKYNKNLINQNNYIWIFKYSYANNTHKYVGSLGLITFHYIDEKVRHREKNNIVVKYYKNSYKKFFYKNKKYLFY